MRIRTLLLAAPAAIALLAAPAAQADWYRHGGWGHPHYAYHHGGWGPGPAVVGTLLGLGAAAVIAGAVAAPPPVYYAPPPAYYPPPPAYYAPPPTYYSW